MPPEAFTCASRSSTAFAIEVPKTLRAPVKGKSAPSRGDGDSSAGATAGGRDEVATTGPGARPIPVQSSMATRARLSVAAGLGIEIPPTGSSFPTARTFASAGKTVQPKSGRMMDPSRRRRHIRLDLLQEFVRVGHPEALDDLAAADPVHVDGRQRDALPRGRHPVERPGVGALESADGYNLVAFRDDVVVHVPTVRERGVQVRETAEEPGPVESGHARRTPDELGVEEVALDLEVAFSIEFQHDRLVAFDGGRLPHLDVGLHEPATVGAGFGVVLTGTFDLGNGYPLRRLRRIRGREGLPTPCRPP